MPEFEWQDWPKEPWVIKPGLDYYASEVIGLDGRGVMLDGREGFPALRRISACVNAVAGVRNPAAVTSVIQAAKEARKAIDHLLDVDAVKGHWRDSALDVVEGLYESLNELKRDPNA